MQSAPPHLRATAALVCAVVLLGALSTARAQRLDLASPLPPDLGDRAWSARRAKSLLDARDLILRNYTANSPHDKQDILQHTHAALLLLSARLLTPPGERRFPSLGDHSKQLGHTLADAIPLINADLAAATRTDPRSIDDLRRFTALLAAPDCQALNALDACTSPDELSTRLADVLCPLRDALVNHDPPDTAQFNADIQRLESQLATLAELRPLPEALGAVSQRLCQLAEHPSALLGASAALARACKTIENARRIGQTPWLADAWAANRDRWLIQGLTAAPGDQAPSPPQPDLNGAWTGIELIAAALDAIDAAEQYRDGSLRLAAYRRALQTAVADPDPAARRCGASPGSSTTRLVPANARPSRSSPSRAMAAPLPAIPSSGRCSTPTTPPSRLWPT